MRIQLFTVQGAFLRAATIPYSNPKPDLITWDSRWFVRDEHKDERGGDASSGYREVFLSYALVDEPATVTP